MMEEHNEGKIENLHEAGSRRWFRRGMEYLDEEAFGAALDAFRRAYQLDPRSVEAIHYYAQELYMQGKIGKAERLARRGLKLNLPLRRLLMLASAL